MALALLTNAKAQIRDVAGLRLLRQFPISIVIDATSDQITASNMPGVIAFSAIAAALLGLGAFAVIRSRKAKAAPAVVDQFPTE